MNVKKIKLADIDPRTEGRIRPINEGYAGILAESFKERGQDTAIEVRYGSGEEGAPKYILVAGGHRFRAVELAEWTDINASISKLNAYASVQREGHQISVPRFDALIEAVYRAELDRLADAAPVLAAQHPPVEALRAWMRLFVDYIAVKLVITPALNGLTGGTGALYAQSGTVLQGAIDGLVAAAVANGDISADIEPVDLLRALAGVSNYAAGPGWETSAKRLVDILIAGSWVSAS
ncbi:hypothetical protein KOEU_33550 [Komagataeibacter europaeus]|uniref:ParB-like N-terminal domain-containing protein n=1 Tax=Komagataeibacter europaeus TaxID=33995 RepID=A0A0M0EDX3_KOMEU|nr:ParB N-terminal domain-containing protein [Komagataeibacter europaeus]KON63156.1 hypothetical protein KOEU_33550 [Komagataeibacter europaeus]